MAMTKSNSPTTTYTFRQVLMVVMGTTIYTGQVIAVHFRIPIVRLFLIVIFWIEQVVAGWLCEK